MEIWQIWVILGLIFQQDVYLGNFLPKSNDLGKGSKKKSGNFHIGGVSAGHFPLLFFKFFLLPMA